MPQRPGMGMRWTPHRTEPSRRWEGAVPFLHKGAHVTPATGRYLSQGVFADPGGGVNMSNEERENVTTERAGLSRRQVLQRGAVIGGAIWIPPIVQSIRVPAAAAVGSPAPCITDTGRLTGSGYAYISGTSGPKVHYDTRGNLNCVPDGTEKFEID